MSVFTTAHCLPPHRLLSPPQPISPTTALEHISNYLADTESSPHLHPDCRFNEHGPTLEGRPPGGGLTLHQLGRVVRGLKGERLGEERVVVDADGLESAVEVETEMIGQGARLGVSDDTMLDLAVEKTAAKLKDAAAEQMNGVSVAMSAQAADADMADEENLVEKSYNQQMLEQGERGDVQEVLGEGQPKVIENVSIPEIEVTGGAKEEGSRKSKKRKRDSAGHKDGRTQKQATQKVVEQQPEKKAKEVIVSSESQGKNEEARASKKARKEARRMQRAQDAEKKTANINSIQDAQHSSEDQAAPINTKKELETGDKVAPSASTTTGIEVVETTNRETGPPSDKRAKKKARQEAKEARKQEVESESKKPEPTSQVNDVVSQSGTNGKREKKKTKSKGKEEIPSDLKPAMAGSADPAALNSKLNGKAVSDQKLDATHNAKAVKDSSQKALKDKSHSSVNQIPDAELAEDAPHKPSNDKSKKHIKDKSAKHSKEDNEQTNPSKGDEAVKEKKKSKKHEKRSEQRRDSKNASLLKLTAKTSADGSTSDLPPVPTTSKPSKSASPPAGDRKSKHKATTSERRAAKRKRQRDASNDAVSPSSIEKEQPSKKKPKHESPEQKAIDVAREKHVTADDKPAKKEKKKKDKKKNKSGESGKSDKASDAASLPANGTAKPAKATSPTMQPQEGAKDESKTAHKKKHVNTSESNAKAPLTDSAPSKKRKLDDAGKESSKSEAKKAKHKDERQKVKEEYSKSQRKRHHQSTQ